MKLTTYRPIAQAYQIRMTYGEATDLYNRICRDERKSGKYFGLAVINSADVPYAWEDATEFSICQAFLDLRAALRGAHKVMKPETAIVFDVDTNGDARILSGKSGKPYVE